LTGHIFQIVVIVTPAVDVGNLIAITGAGAHVAFGLDQSAINPEIRAILARRPINIEAGNINLGKRLSG
jgi:hypothetical protein